MNHKMLELIDTYLTGLPAERDIVTAKEVRDLLLDIRLTFMVVDGDPEPAPPAPGSRIQMYRWNPQAIPPVDGPPPGGGTRDPGC